MWGLKVCSSVPSASSSPPPPLSLFCFIIILLFLIHLSDFFIYFFLFLLIFLLFPSLKANVHSLDLSTVSIDIDNKRAFKECFTVGGVILPTGYFFGVSAATGDLSDAHDLISMKLYDISTPDDVSIWFVFSLWYWPIWFVSIWFIFTGKSISVVGEQRRYRIKQFCRVS